MGSFRHFHNGYSAALSAMTLFLTLGNADVPATYKGKPYGGTPRSLPGRIEFEDYDLGGVNVAWKCDNKAGAAGSSAAGRGEDGETQHPAFYMTNKNATEAPDAFADKSLYPSAAQPSSVYIGATHASDWANVTVDVKKAGTYWVSSTFASDETQIKFHLSFNGVNKSGMVAFPSVKNFHEWKKFNDCAKVVLDSGVQVMQFYIDNAHLNWDYLYFSQDSGAATGIGGKGIRASGNNTLAAVLFAAGDRSTLGFSLPDAGQTRISLFDVGGREMKSLLNRRMPAGKHSMNVDLTDAPEGVYFLRIGQNGIVSSTKVQVTR
jgi:hypothetical protein